MNLSGLYVPSMDMFPNDSILIASGRPLHPGIPLSSLTSHNVAEY